MEDFLCPTCKTMVNQFHICRKAPKPRANARDTYKAALVLGLMFRTKVNAIKAHNKDLPGGREYIENQVLAEANNFISLLEKLLSEQPHENPRIGSAAAEGTPARRS